MQVNWCKNIKGERNILEHTFKTTIIDLIKNLLSHEEFKQLTAKINNRYSLSELLKKICNKRCVQKRKPF